LGVAETREWLSLHFALLEIFLLPFLHSLAATDLKPLLMKLTIAVRISLKCEIEITILENNLGKSMHVAQKPNKY